MASTDPSSTVAAAGGGGRDSTEHYGRPARATPQGGADPSFRATPGRGHLAARARRRGGRLSGRPFEPATGRSPRGLGRSACAASPESAGEQLFQTRRPSHRADGVHPNEVDPTMKLIATRTYSRK